MHGMPMGIGRNLGQADARMTERHYAIAPSHVADTKDASHEGS